MAPLNDFPAYTALIPKCIAPLSFLGSLYIVVDFVRNSRNDCVRPIRRVLCQNSTGSNKSGNSTYKRLIFAMSCVDMCKSVAQFLGTWPMPEDSGSCFAAGNDATCAVQAFLVQMSLASPCYNLSLSVYYLLVVAHGWKRRQIVAIEPYLHVLPLLAGLGTSVAAACLGLFGSAGPWCWIVAKKPFYRLAFFYVPLWCCIFGVTVVMAITTRAVFATEKRSDRWGSTRKQALGRQVASQALWFVGAMYLTYTSSTANRIFQLITGEISGPLFALHMALGPGLGFYNFLVYSRPRYLRYRKDKKRREDKKNKEEKEKEEKEKQGPLAMVADAGAADTNADDPSLTPLLADQEDHSVSSSSNKNKGRRTDKDEEHATTESVLTPTHKNTGDDGKGVYGGGYAAGEEDVAAHEILDDPATAMLAEPGV